MSAHISPSDKKGKQGRGQGGKEDSQPGSVNVPRPASTPVCNSRVFSRATKTGEARARRTMRHWLSRGFTHVPGLKLREPRSLGCISKKEGWEGEALEHGSRGRITTSTTKESHEPRRDAVRKRTRIAYGTVAGQRAKRASAAPRNDQPERRERRNGESNQITLRGHPTMGKKKRARCFNRGRHDDADS